MGIFTQRVFAQIQALYGVMPPREVTFFESLLASPLRFILQPLSLFAIGVVTIIGILIAAVRAYWRSHH
jgi:hypothetical protein